MKFICLFVLGIYIPVFCSAQDVIELNEKESYYVAEAANYLETKDTASIDFICSAEDWQLSQSNAFKLKDKRNSLWVRFRYRNTRYNQIYLHVGTPNLDKIEVYLYKELQGTSGDELVLSKRQIKDAYPCVLLPATDSEGVEVLVKLEMAEDFMIPLLLQTPQRYHDERDKRQLYTGLYFGAMALIFGYNLFLFIAIRNRIFLYYIIYIAFVTLTQLSIFSNISAILYPNSSFWIERDVFIFSSILGLAIAPFVFKLLDLKNSQNTLFRVFVSFLTVYGTALILSFTEKLSIAIDVLSALNLASSVLLLYAGIKLLAKQVHAKYFISAWSIFLLGAIAFIIQNYGLIPYNMVSNYAMAYGTIIEALILSLALSYNYNDLMAKYILRDKQLNQLSLEFGTLHKNYGQVQLRLNAMKLEPHYVFNTLTSIHHYLIKNDANKAADLLLGFAKVTRTILNLMERDFITLEEEVQAVMQYAQVQLNREERPSEVRIQIAHELSTSLLVPPLILQPIVENCIKHAFIGDIDTAVICLTARIDKSRKLVCVTVEDNGIGLVKSSSNHQSKGLAIVNDRLAALKCEMDQEKGHAVYVPKESPGTKVNVYIPVMLKYEN